MLKRISKEGEAFYYNKDTNAFCLINKKKCYEFLCLIKPNLPIQFKNKNYIDIVKDDQFNWKSDKGFYALKIKDNKFIVVGMDRVIEDLLSFLKLDSSRCLDSIQQVDKFSPDNSSNKLYIMKYKFSLGGKVELFEKGSNKPLYYATSKVLEAVNSWQIFDENGTQIANLQRNAINYDLNFELEYSENYEYKYNINARKLPNSDIFVKNSSFWYTLEYMKGGTCVAIAKRKIVSVLGEFRIEIKNNDTKNLIYLIFLQLIALGEMIQRQQQIQAERQRMMYH